MLQPYMHRLSACRIVLASGSPRRRQILQNIGLKFEIIPSTFEENLQKSSFSQPFEYAIATAKHKALEVAKRLSSEKVVPDLVIGCDTVVSQDGEIFEKPRSKDHAFEMLSRFSGKEHIVYTGVTLVWNIAGCKDPEDYTTHTFYAATKVYFASVDPETIRSYIETGEPMDKAGGYGIQAVGGTLIEKIDGDYFNVMGFPLNKFAQVLVNKFLK